MQASACGPRALRAAWDWGNTVFFCALGGLPFWVIGFDASSACSAMPGSWGVFGSLGRLGGGGPMPLLLGRDYQAFEASNLAHRLGTMC